MYVDRLFVFIIAITVIIGKGGRGGGGGGAHLLVLIAPLYLEEQTSFGRVDLFFTGLCLSSGSGNKSPHLVKCRAHL